MARPITKPNRKKIGLSIDLEVNNMLNDLVEKTGKTKSRIFEEAMRVMIERESIIESRRKKIEELGDDAFLNLEKVLQERRDSNKNWEDRNVKIS
jgi:predicted DNA-binding protein